MSEFRSKELSDDWKLRDATDTNTETWYTVTAVPTVVHLDLLQNGIIPDPFIGLNEEKAQWVAERDWIYQTTFETPPGDPKTRHSVAFDGLDTFATVKLNGNVILRSDNMFIPHRVDITDILASSPSTTNTLEILFESALLRAREVVKSHPEHRHIAHQTEVGRLGARKAAYHWGWDWGPILVTAGPWRPVTLESYADRIDDLWIESTVADDLRSCAGKIRVRTEGRGADRVHIALWHEGKVAIEADVEVDPQGEANVSFCIESPALWFPHGYGPQSRYEIRAELFLQDDLLHAKSKRTGFRRAELIQEKDEHGQSFYFRINNVDVFASGSCWIPGDSFLPQITDAKYRKWLTLIVEGNQNMIRIWGGGIFEPEVFYETCDELGIMVFQDFLFACASYPTYPEYLQSVEKEARANVQLLRHHPSIVIYAGNNEDYQIQQKYNLTYDYDGDKDPESWLKSSFPARYIYEYLLPKVVEEESPGMAYHPSSPWGGGRHTTDPTIGDIHQWDVWHGTMEPYQKLSSMGGRFNSEFGMEAFPHMYTIDSFVDDPEERYHQSLTMDFHNKASGHERRLGAYILENFNVKQDLKAYIHLSQIAQSETMTFAYRSWRREWGRKRRCGGVLVWQLNDCWPTISWAIVDYFLVKKPAFYAIARASQPLAIGVSRRHKEWTSGHARSPSSVEFDVWTASSKAERVHAVVTVRYISVETGHDFKPASVHTVEVVPNGTTEILGDRVDLNRNSTEKEEVQPFVIFATLSVDGAIVSRDFDWPQPLKYLKFRERDVKVEFLKEESSVRVAVSKPTKGLVFEERPGIWFGDNGIDLVPGDERIIPVKGIAGYDSIPRWTYIGDNRF
ncbi:glycoside hydrolase [Aspergillus steynii IBT 23096]|uniref:Beta-mannosidase B n=1 Tax=Aspergillus steynii IBT 23096 TaxID=1392250 RepID=A0A2I2GER6_9EURO|nr:glycoside hydrolase [Aspergillus steynii IBT 23096]PLB51373.1 glycoside hydrolase [Aspergillus steynii IBT 23096]